MQIWPARIEGEHKVYLDDKHEAFQIARGMGLWRYSGIKLMAAAMTGPVGFQITTVNLETIEKNLKTPIPVLSAYVGEALMAKAEVFVSYLENLEPAVSV